MSRSAMMFKPSCKIKYKTISPMCVNTTLFLKGSVEPWERWEGREIIDVERKHIMKRLLGEFDHLGLKEGKYNCVYKFEVIMLFLKTA